MAFFDVSEIKSRRLAPGVEIKVVPGEKMMMVFFFVEPGGIIPEHSHPHEQMGIVLEGEVQLSINGEKRIAREGDAYHVPSGVLHSGSVSGSRVRVLDVFVPPREDYR
jgi:quercetin dioxygenase-like cupin family protein